MKFFILFAIIFFSFRLFSEDTYYYEGRYYKVDEYIRFLDDPDYRAFMKEKREEERAQKAQVNSYFYEKDQEAIQQEKERRQYLAEYAEPTDAELLKAEAQHEKEKLAEMKQFEALQKQYLVELDQELAKSKPSRMIASVFETDDEKPMKRIPLNKRKYVLKGKAPKKKKPTL